jgi:2'-5' RNA ligase
MRCFVALKVPDAVRAVAARVQEALRRADADVKWVAPESLHLTLKFLGELGDEAVARLGGLLAAEAPRWPKLRLTWAGTGRFPERGDPKIVWAGCGGDVARLAGLAGAVERAAEQVGVPREGRPFVAHLTLGRVKSPRNAKRLAAALEGQREVALGTDEAAGFALFESALTPRGPVYEERAWFPLGG